ncbi:thioredoxin family protein [Aestuariispira insulae]|uniref:Thioredoxin n=1 Tax=Aestuariispira insulae TaxID=1461337 RepID=A0A3D9HPW4_9PROT|nr:co-chaperone YbbN [Aestuariispira insulae]RED51528.1 thioredoxin [Aestuariispira insulae]
MSSIIGIQPPKQPAGEAQPTGDYIKDSTDRDFGPDVMELSQQVPVIVDFWAPWCGPCKQLGPVLEKIVNDAKGKLRLVKINIDENPGIAQQLRVQSIPAVFAFFGGRPVDGFMGALPESQIKTFTDKLIEMSGGVGGDDPLEAALEQAKLLLEEDDMEQAMAILQQVVAHAPENVEAITLFADCLLKQGQLEPAKQLFETLPEDTHKDQKVAALKAALELAGESEGALAEMQALQARIDADADDHEARMGLASAVFATGRADVAIDHLLHIIAADREWNDGAARQQLLKFFEALGHADPVTVAGRRKLSAILFS